MKAYDIVKTARDTKRISTTDIINALTSSFMECHGDRAMGDDRAVIGGVGLMNEEPITIIGIEKGRSTEENISRNFGSSGPGGYRKAERLMDQAEKFQRPVLTLINTPGAFAAPESEENGIGEAIASSLIKMSELTVPTLSIILGEGGSGGAIGLALTDQVWMMENSVYSILSPEGFASILWKDSKLAPDAAEIMKLTAKDLKELEVVDRVIPETDGEEEIPKEQLLNQLLLDIKKQLDESSSESVSTRLEKRQQRFRKF